MKLIVGVDPGATVAWGALDLSGKLVGVGSQKGLSVDGVVHHLSRLGKVVIVGTDKAKLPGFVRDVCAKFGALSFCPVEDVRVSVKRDLVDVDVNNSHELDALASALIAFRKFQPLFVRVRSFLSDVRQLGLFEDVVELVLKEGISIHAAFSILSVKPSFVVEAESLVEEKDADVVKLYGELSRVRKDNGVLLRMKDELEFSLSQFQEELDFLKEKSSGLVVPRSRNELLRAKDSQIASLSQRFRNSVKVVDDLKKQINILESSLLLNDRVAVPFFVRLSWDEFVKNKDFVGSVVFVESLDGVSDKAVSSLKSSGVELVICKSFVRNSLPFAVVKADKFDVLGRVVFIDKVWLAKVRSEKTVLAKIITEYQQRQV